MPIQVDPSAMLPIGSILIVALAFFISLHYWPTRTEMTKEIAKLREEQVQAKADFAEKYMLKTDVEKKLDDFKKDVHEGFADMKSGLTMLSNKVDALVNALLEGKKP